MKTVSFNIFIPFYFLSIVVLTLVMVFCPMAAVAQLAVAGQENGPKVAVIDISNPASPTVVGSVTTSLVGIESLAVDPAGSRVVAGEKNGCRVAIIDISNPAVPVQTGTYCTTFAGISSVAVTGNKAVVGQQFGPGVALLDISGASPTLLGSQNTVLTGISSVAASGTRALAGEENGNRLVVLDISGATPTVVGSSLNTTLVGISSVAASGTRGVAGQLFGPGVAAVNIGGTPSLGGKVNTVLVGISSIALSGTRGLAGEENGSRVVVFDVSNISSPTVVGSALLTSFPGISSVAASGNLGVAGQKFGPGIRIINNLTGTPTLAGSVNVPFIGVSSVAATSYVPPTPPAAVVASSLSFGNVTVGTSSSLPLTFQNNGGQTLIVSGITSSSPRFIPSPTSLNVPPGGSASLNITFTPNSVITFSANLTMNTNDPARPTITVLLTGTGVLTPPTAVVSPTALAFGTVRVGTSSTQTLTVQNTGGQTLQLTNIASNNSHFVSTSTTLSVPAGGSLPLNVTFSPDAETTFNGILTANTNDPARPTINFALSGTGGLPHIQVSSTSINFGNVAVCLSATKTLTVNNTGALPLVVSAINLPVGPFTRTPVSLTVPASGSANVQVTFTPVTTGSATATMTLVSDDPASPNLSVNLAGNGTSTPPPAISVFPNAINFGATLVNFFIGKQIDIKNTSACSVLNVMLNTAVTSGPATFPVTTGTPTAVPATTSLSGTVPAGGTVPFVVVFAPTGTGLVQGTLTISSNDLANPTVTIPLQGTGVQASASSLSMILDRSGSMAEPAPGGTKMDALKTSAKLFTDLLIEGQGDRLGSVEFDNQYSVLTQIADVTASQKSTVKNGIDTLYPRGMTSIGGGLQTGLSQLSVATTPRKILMVFTDGMENTPPWIANIPIPSGTEVYSVGLGDPAYISTAALSQLAINSNGRFFNPADTLLLRKDFVQVLSDAFRMNMAADPIYTISSGRTQILYVPLCDCDRRASFVIYWDNPATQLTLEVVAPDGTVYKPTSSATNRLVRYMAQPGYIFYQIAFPPVDTQPGAIIGPPRTGYWQMKVSAVKLAGTTERFSANVLVESDFDVKVDVSPPKLGQPLTFIARLRAEGKPVPGARVIATITQPLRGLGNILSKSGLRETDLREMPLDDRFGLDFRARAIRYLVEKEKRMGRHLIPTKQTKIQLFDDGKHGDGKAGDGVYAAVLPKISVEGVYTVELKAIAGVCNGKATRETTFSVFAPVIPDIKNSGPVIVPGSTPGTAVVTVHLRDTLGNSIGPGSANLIGIQIPPEDGQPDPIKDNLNGSYTFTIRKVHKNSVLLLEIGGHRKKIRLFDVLEKTKGTGKDRQGAVKEKMN